MKNLSLLFLACITLFVSGCKKDETITDPTLKTYAGFRLQQIKVTKVPNLYMDSSWAVGNSQRADMYVTLEQNSVELIRSTTVDNVNLPFTATSSLTDSNANLNKDKSYIISVYDANTVGGDQYMGLVSFKPSIFNGETIYTATYSGTEIEIIGTWYE
jgi:hypothetical protein